MKNLCETYPTVYKNDRYSLPCICYHNMSVSCTIHLMGSSETFSVEMHPQETVLDMKKRLVESERFRFLTNNDRGMITGMRIVDFQPESTEVLQHTIPMNQLRHTDLQFVTESLDAIEFSPDDFHPTPPKNTYIIFEEPEYESVRIIGKYTGYQSERYEERDGSIYDMYYLIIEDASHIDTMEYVGDYVLQHMVTVRLGRRSCIDDWERRG